MLFPRWVSILVLVDVLPERCDYRQFIDRPQVSILVLVDVLPEPTVPVGGEFARVHVSILVLVDVLPEPLATGRNNT